MYCAAVNLELDGDDTDFDQDQIDSITAALNEMGVTCRRAICSEPMIEVTERLNLFSLPAVLVFDATGSRVYHFDGEFTYLGTIVPKVSELLAAMGEP